MLAPERHLASELRTLQPATLPYRVIGILDRQRRQGVGTAFAKRGVQRGELPHHHTPRPAITDDVVLRHQQHMLLVGKPQQAPTDQRTLGKIERRRSFLGGQFGDMALLFVGRYLDQILLE